MTIIKAPPGELNKMATQQRDNVSKGFKMYYLNLRDIFSALNFKKSYMHVFSVSFQYHYVALHQYC